MRDEKGQLVHLVLSFILKDEKISVKSLTYLAGLLRNIPDFDLTHFLNSHNVTIVKWEDIPDDEFNDVDGWG